MTTLRALMKRNCSFALVLLAVALLARAAVPQGWMPDTAPERLTVRLCTAHGAVEVPLPGQREGPAQPDREQPPCALGGLALAAAPPNEMPGLPLPAVSAESYQRDHAALVLAHAARQMPPARGPPASV